MEEKKKPGKAGRSILIVAVLALVAALGIPSGMRYREKEQKKAKIEEARAYFEDDLPDVLRDAYVGFPLDGELTIKTKSRWNNYVFRGSAGYQWKDELSVTLVTDASFHDLTDREKYEYLRKFGSIGINAYQHGMKKICPDYFQAWRLTAGAYDKTVYTSHNYDFYIVSGGHVYKDLPTMRDCYATDRAGRVIHYLKDPQSIYYEDPDQIKATPVPTKLPAYTPKAKSSKTTTPSDPDEADLYDDPDEYADWYAEEFAEELDVDGEEGYWEAYDHWTRWHEMYD